MAIPVALDIAAALLSACSNCPDGCPAAAAGLTFGVQSPGGGPVPGVEVTFGTPPDTSSFFWTCVDSDTGTRCSWPTSDPAPGTYALTALAGGYQPAEVQTTLSLASTQCGCPYAELNPSAVTMQPNTDGGP